MSVLTDLSVEAMAAANEANLYAASPFTYNLPRAEVHKGDDICWFFTGIPLLPCNMAFRSHLKREQIDGTIESLIEKARARNVPFRWLVGKDSEPADLGEHLTAHGFTSSGPGPMMAIDLPSMNKSVRTPSNLVITEVDNSATFGTWCHIAAQSFMIPPEREPALSKWFTIALDMGLPVHFYLAYQNGDPVATSQLFLAEGVAGIYYVATIPQARNRGIGYAVTLTALEEALRIGYRVGTLQASKMGEPVYLRMGFKEVGKITGYRWAGAPPDS